MEPEHQPPNQPSLIDTSLSEDKDVNAIHTDSRLVASPSQSPQPATGESVKKPIPDQATIDALLQVTREEHERRQKGDGRTIRHWWNPAEWIDSTPEMRRNGLIKAGIAIGLTIILTIVTDRLAAHSGIKL